MYAPNTHTCSLEGKLLSFILVFMERRGENKNV